MEQQHIDSLLERYLALIDEYSRLREELSKLQAGVYQNIARANFTGERGMRYGQDHYDERMRALRVLDIQLGDDDVPNFSMRSSAPPADEVDGDGEGRKEGENREDSLEGEQPDNATAQGNSVDSNEEKQSPEEQEKDEQEEGKKKTKERSNNPLHWFSILAPAPLRTAQSLSIQAVEQAIPRLISVNAEMEHIEIEIRRARKKRAKAAAAAVVEKEALGMEAVEAR
ncbi:hypothetical protein TARUN_9420 [Trichoderma arundinaceum]|uniref:Vacuolar ATPase assembly protein VMA22 n=1 Tax=Trichoderma arundinaceum TaxID=490622 RepID=A0A395N9P6_TRIAR|nr:hypothetical protein TARUN_9420 [Trichoderma arundinaceum]